jgi:hypothetical protein
VNEGAPVDDGAPPQIRLGELQLGGLAPAILAIVERGVSRRPTLAARMLAEIELDFGEPYPPVRIVFGEGLMRRFIGLIRV